MAAKYRVFKGKDGKVYWQLKAANGQVILQSQGYAAKSSAMNGIASVRTNCGNKNCFETKQAKDGQHYFNMKATNGQVIGSSEMYVQAASCENGIASVMANAETERMDDETLA